MGDLSKFDIFDYTFLISMTLLLILFAVYILTLSYHTLKAARLKKEFYSSSARLAKDLEFESKRFTRNQKDLDRQIKEINKDSKHTCNKLKDELKDELKEIKDELKAIRSEVQAQNKEPPKEKE